VFDLLPVSLGLQPNLTPRRFGAFTPARVRSLIRLRSSSASTPIICHMARPAVFRSHAKGANVNTELPQDGAARRVDSIRTGGISGNGDLRWMTAGSGIIHQEMPKGDWAPLWCQSR